MKEDSQRSQECHQEISAISCDSSRPITATDGKNQRCDGGCRKISGGGNDPHRGSDLGSVIYISGIIGSDVRSNLCIVAIKLWKRSYVSLVDGKTRKREGNHYYETNPSRKRLAKYSVIFDLYSITLNLLEMLDSKLHWSIKFKINFTLNNFLLSPPPYYYWQHTLSFMISYLLKKLGWSMEGARVGATKMRGGSLQIYQNA